jgi:hypothetical protein
MIAEIENHPVENTASIISGIVDDLRELVKKEIRLAQEEIKEDLRRARNASMFWFAGVGVLCLSAVPLIFMLVHALHTATSPAGSDPASVPLWACYAIVAALLGIVGYIMVIAGQKRFERVTDVVDKQIRAVTKEAPNG